VSLEPLENISLQDDNIDPEDRRLIEMSKEVELTTRTPGWDIIKQEILANCKDYDAIVIKSSSMEETYGAAKTLSGLKFVLELVDELIDDGQKAIERYKKS
jgi:hypothetical protein